MFAYPSFVITEIDDRKVEKSGKFGFYRSDTSESDLRILGQGNHRLLYSYKKNIVH